MSALDQRLDRLWSQLVLLQAELGDIIKHINELRTHARGDGEVAQLPEPPLSEGDTPHNEHRGLHTCARCMGPKDMSGLLCFRCRQSDALATMDEERA